MVNIEVVNNELRYSGIRKKKIKNKYYFVKRGDFKRRGTTRTQRHFTTLESSSILLLTTLFSYHHLPTRISSLSDCILFLCSNTYVHVSKHDMYILKCVCNPNLWSIAMSSRIFRLIARAIYVYTHIYHVPGSITVCCLAHPPPGVLYDVIISGLPPFFLWGWNKTAEL